MFHVEHLWPMFHVKHPGNTKGGLSAALEMAPRVPLYAGGAGRTMMRLK